ncbi:MAG: exodeoxyribonuclease VII large subunit [Burkholderiaceae bacterium]
MLTAIRSLLSCNRLLLMSRQYLDVPYKAKDAAKALGARFDFQVKRWYVDAGTDLVAFTPWLPADALPAASTSRTLALPTAPSNALATVRQGMPLSQLLNGVAAAVAQAFSGGVWTLVEVNAASARNGHVYLELSERDSAGQPVARAKAMIWAQTASRILPEFEHATGAVIGAGIKLLVRARPVFKAQYGFSLEIDAIDPDYTLGDLEARKKEIRARLQQEGVFDLNRQLAPPWDYRLVLVVAPEDAAGLGDFQKEAERLANFGVCHFFYAHSRFQGDGAANEIVAATRKWLAYLAPEYQPDAIVILRGGGAVNDLAWLNDYTLARFICDQTIPVFTGIGHERDSTLPDEVAHSRFDTPSKVIAGIEQQILRRSREARHAWDAIQSSSAQATRTMRLALEQHDAAVRAGAGSHLARARQDSTAAFNEIAVGAVHQVHDASRQSLQHLHAVKTAAVHELATVRQQVPALMAMIRIEALSSVSRAKAATRVAWHTAIDQAAAATRAVRRDLDAGLRRVAERADSAVQRARGNAQALVREVTGQGPDKTLTRGFAIVRTARGRPVTTLTDAQAQPALTLQFKDGVIRVCADRSSTESTTP